MAPVAAGSLVTDYIIATGLKATMARNPWGWGGPAPSRELGAVAGFRFMLEMESGGRRDAETI